MLQQVMTNPGEIIFREVPVPEIKDDQVLVKIMNIGICGSDIHVYHGFVITCCNIISSSFIYHLLLNVLLK